MSGDQKIRVGSRKSELALIQTRHVISLLKQHYPDKEFEIVTMSTLGDKVLDIPLPKIGEKSLFTKELEIALSTGCVDFVVHSLKDLPTALPSGMAIGAVLEREDPRDALVLQKDLSNLSLAELPKDSIIGTSSLRRAAQLGRIYPHLKVESIRGNLNTRLKKLDELGQFQAIILAAAGLARMGWNHRITKIINTDELLYAVGQGALAVECRECDIKTIELLRPLYDIKTAISVITERSFLKTLGGGCSAPVAVETELIKVEEKKLKISFTGAVWSLDGKEEIKDNDDCVVEIKEFGHCATCPFGYKRESVNVTSKSNCSQDIECLKECITSSHENNVKSNECTKDLDTNPNKKQKLSDNERDLTNLLKNDPHEHCPIEIPVGMDFMGKCPYLESNLTNINVRKCPVNGQIIGTNNLNVTKCPFLKEGQVNVLPETNNIPSSSKTEVGTCPYREPKLYCGLVPHLGVPISALESAQKLGEELAERLMKRGATEVMAKAQACIRNTSS